MVQRLTLNDHPINFLAALGVYGLTTAVGLEDMRNSSLNKNRLNSLLKRDFHKLIRVPSSRIKKQEKTKICSNNKHHNKANDLIQRFFEKKWVKPHWNDVIPWDTTLRASNMWEASIIIYSVSMNMNNTSRKQIQAILWICKCF